MAILNDPEYIYNYIKTNPEFKFWRVHSNKDAFGEFTDEGGTVEQSITSLKALLSCLRGTVEVSIRSRVLKAGGDTQSGKYNFKIDLGNTNQFQNTNNLQQPQPNNNAGFPTIYELMNDNFKLKMELLELKLKGTGDVQDKVQKNIIFNRIMDIFEGKEPTNNPSIAGQQAPANGHQPDNQKKDILLDSLHILRKDDPNFHEKIAKLAKLKSENPDAYNLAIQALENM